MASDALGATARARLRRRDCRRRAAGEPLAYLTGDAEFHGLTLQVDRAVLVPRPDTETLVDWALELPARAERDDASPAGGRPRHRQRRDRTGDRARLPAGHA